MNAVDGATIERRIRISRPDKGRGRCKGSRAWDPRKDFSQCMQQPIILSTSSAISPQQERTEPSGHQPCRHGVKSSLRREPDVPGNLLRAIFGNVTEPYAVASARFALSAALAIVNVSPSSTKARAALSKFCRVRSFWPIRSAFRLLTFMADRT